MASHSSSLEMNKIAGALLVGGMIALISGILASALVSPKPIEHAAVSAPEGATGATAAATPEAALEPVSPLLAAADPAAGQDVAKRCLTCHTFEKGGPAKIGPNLWGIIGAKHGHMEGFAYSPALLAKEGPWTYEDLNAYLASPRSYAPGTKMTFAGLKKVADRANVIAWLRTMSDNPPPLPDPSAAAPAATQTAATAESTDAAATDSTTAGGEVTGAPAATGAAETPPAAEGETAGETSAAAATEQTASGPSLAALLAGADLAAGEKIAKRCVTCHSFAKDGANKVGPNLWGIVGAPHAHRADYNYSPAMKSAGGVWTYEALDAYLTTPRAVVPGTKMTFAGLKDAKQRADLIAWLRTLSDDPPPLP